jgi:hypothetical protein
MIQWLLKAVCEVAEPLVELLDDPESMQPEQLPLQARMNRSTHPLPSR